MFVIYIILTGGAALFVGWILYALNTEFELFIWVDSKRRYAGCFDCLSDARDYIALQETKGVNVTDWKIETVKKKKYVKQVDDKLLVGLINANIITSSPINNRLVQLSIDMQKEIDKTKRVIGETKLLISKSYEN